MTASRRWFGSTNRIEVARRSRRAGRSGKSRRLMLESLESRTVLSGISFFDFSNVSSLNIVGDAATTPDNRLRLTPAAGGMEGAAWYSAEKQFVANQFSTTFQFQMTDGFDAPGGSDGLVFVIQNTNPTYLAGGGGTLGYHQLANSLAIEFDTFQNSEVNDPSHSHISIHTNGTGPNSWDESLSLGSYSTTPALLDDGALHTAKITYDSGVLSVYLDDLQTPKIAVAVDLSDLLSLDAGRAWVGFTATTGGGYQNQDILNWSFDATVPPTFLAIADVSTVEGYDGLSPMVFTVTRSGDLTEATTVQWTTVDGTATSAGGDYVAASGLVSFGPGESVQQVTVNVIGDTALEPHETFSISLTGSSAFVVDATGTGTILNDEVTIFVSDATAQEGSSTLQYRDDFVSGGQHLARATSATFGPDGHLYVVSLDNDSVLRYDGTSGQYMDTVISSGAEGLDRPWFLVFGPDKRLYVAGVTSNNIVRWDPATGIVDTFIPSTSVLWGPKGMAFDAAGNLYVCNADRGGSDVSELQDQVVKFAPDGSFLGVFVARGSGGLDNPNHLMFHGDYLYVTNTRGDSVNRYDANTGAFVDVLVVPQSGGLDVPTYLSVGPDGSLYVSGQGSRAVHRYNLATGAFVDIAAPSEHFSIGGPQGQGWDSDGNLYVAGGGENKVVRFAPAYQAVFQVTLNAASADAVTVHYATANGNAIDGSDYDAVTGVLTFQPGETVKTVIVKSLDDAVYEGSESFTLDLSNSSAGAVIVDRQGLGTIVDDDPGPTKFFVVNDGSPDRTYEYEASGREIESYSINNANTAPRGAASTAAGDKVWVVDANKKVYVYDTSGRLLGSWSAGGLSGSAQLEGIATNGVDIWLVDNKSDKVYRYANAAGRISGSQNAISSFALFNKGPVNPDYSNKNPKDIVTDGAYLWVVNDGVNEDKVFKYTLSGTAVWNNGWSIDPVNSQPTGITLDPSNPNHIWIVDAGMDRVYQYDGAVWWEGGGLPRSASASFALAAGNTNPQGIADPPAPGSAMVEGTSEGDVLLGSGLIDQVLSDDEAAINLAETDLPLSLAARRRVQEASDGEVEQVDRWYASLADDYDCKASRWSAELDGQLDELVDVALAE